MLRMVRPAIFTNDNSLRMVRPAITTNYKCSFEQTIIVCFGQRHSQLTSLTAMFWSLYICYQTSLSTSQKIFRILIMWILAGLVWYSRVHIGCHNWIQIFGGVFMGSLFGLLAFYIMYVFNN